MNALSDPARHQQHRADAAREQLGRCRAVDLTADTGFLRLGRARNHRHGPIEQRRQVARQYLGSDIHQQGVLAQPADTLQSQPVLQTLERLLDAPAPVIQSGQLGHRSHVFVQGRQQCPDTPAGADVAHQTSMHARGAVQLPNAGLLRIAGREPAPAFTQVTAQEAARSGPALGAVAADDEVNAALGQGLYRPGGRITPVQDQHIAPVQPIELVKEHLKLTLGLGTDGHMQHQIVARQEQAQGTLNRGGQGSGAQTGALGRSQDGTIGTDQTATLEQVQLALALNGIDQAVIERPQGGHMQLGAGLDQGAVRDHNADAVSALAGEESIEFALDAATAKAQQGRQQRGQRQLARAGEGVGMIGAAGQIGKGRAVQMIGESGQKRLCETTALRREVMLASKENQTKSTTYGLCRLEFGGLVTGQHSISCFCIFSAQLLQLHAMRPHQHDSSRFVPTKGFASPSPMP